MLYFKQNGMSSTKLRIWSYIVTKFCFPWCNSPQWVRASSLQRLHDHTQTHIILGRTPLDEWSARPRDLYLTTQHSQETDIHARRRDSNPKSQLARDRRYTPYTARWTLRSAVAIINDKIKYNCWHGKYIEIQMLVRAPTNQHRIQE